MIEAHMIAIGLKWRYGSLDKRDVNQLSCQGVPIVIIHSCGVEFGEKKG